MVRILRATLAAAAVTAALAAPAGAATWTPVRGTISGYPSAATLDGPRVLVASTSYAAGKGFVTIVDDGRVTRRQTLRAPGHGGRVRHLQLTSLPGGRALAVWQASGAVLASLRPSARAAFGPAETVSSFPGAATGVAGVPVLVVTSDGEPVIVWRGAPEGTKVTLLASSMEPGGRWGAPVDITGGVYPVWPLGQTPAARDFAVAADPAGGVVAAWFGRFASFVGPVVVGAARAPTGAWGPVTDLGVADPNAAAPSVVSPEPGVLVAAWLDGSGRRMPQRGCATSAVLRAGSVTPTDIMCSPIDYPAEVLLAPTTGGGALLATQFGPLRAENTSGRQYVSTLGAASPWTPVQTVVARLGRMSGLATAAGGRTALLTVGKRPGRNGFPAVRVVLLGADGTVQQRIPGPPRPAVPRNAGVQLLPLGPGSRVALLLTPTTWESRTWRPSILTVGPG